MGSVRYDRLLLQVTSTRSSFGRRNRALAVLEQQLALACVQSSNDDTLETYLNLQDAFESNGGE